MLTITVINSAYQLANPCRIVLRRSEKQHSSTPGQVAGPEKALDAGATGTLVLMWPDYGGQGVFALEALEMFEGPCLICVREHFPKIALDTCHNVERVGKTFESTPNTIQRASSRLKPRAFA